MPFHNANPGIKINDRFLIVMGVQQMMQRKQLTQGGSSSPQTREVEPSHHKKKKGLLLFILLLAACTLSFGLFLRSSLFTLERIEIRGLDKVPAEEFRRTTRLQEGMNIWSINPPLFREKALAIPRVQSVQVERDLPAALVVHVEEKCPAALVSYHGYYLELAPDGTFIGIQNHYTGDLPLINGLLWGQMDVGSSIPDRPRGEIIEVFLEALAERPALPLAEINVENPQQITVYTWEGMEVWMGGKHDLARKIDLLHSIYIRLKQNRDELLAGCLDLRVVETPVFRPFRDQ